MNTTPLFYLDAHVIVVSLSCLFAFSANIDICVCVKTHFKDIQTKQIPELHLEADPTQNRPLE